MKKIIGRAKEQQLLAKHLNSNQAELLAIYGRRRIGKTFLIREFFNTKNNIVFFEIMGQKDSSLAIQLKNFSLNFSEKFFSGIPLQSPKSWNDALILIETQIKKSQKKFILFFDEVPWLASQKSGFLEALDYFWNSRFYKYPQLKIILCGSAASWMINNIVNNKGGLHNRLTGKINLLPFNIKETKEFCDYKKLKYNNISVIELYMTIGGIPYYLNALEKGKSVVQNINYLFCSQHGLLIDEFNNLYDSLFDNAALSKKIVINLAYSPYGLSREILMKKLKISSGGTFSNKMEELISAGFVQEFTPLGYSTKNKIYKLVDEFSLFYLYWFDKQNLTNNISEDYLINHYKSPKYNIWAGHAFERLCLKHINELGDELGLHNLKVTIHQHNLQVQEKGDMNQYGAQYDLVIMRSDNVIQICEIKYHDNKYVIGKNVARSLTKKIAKISELFPSKDIQIYFITPNGIKENIWSEDLIDGSICFSDFWQ